VESINAIEKVGTTWGGSGPDAKSRVQHSPYITNLGTVAENGIVHESQVFKGFLVKAS